jgi:hypothetical protein
MIHLGATAAMPTIPPPGIQTIVITVRHSDEIARRDVEG